MTLSPAFLDVLMSYSWKGNIRELRNVIERAVILADGPTLLPESLPLDVQSSANTITSSASDLETVEKKHIAQIMHYTHGNKAKTARLLGIGLSTLYRKIEQYQLITTTAILISAAKAIYCC
ncbi:helix-turn-helix domain-containing protein [Spirosoma sp. KNUC1025]|uniref:helix-turn-helix domain-containing protein n=1 Tax=Spirosoma sp. KNUC1025 TaxID=2894082 RepID=UPI003862E169|nr:hypothetical protein LN737_13880 [Spirosoma sp. KNUC1025]